MKIIFLFIFSLWSSPALTHIIPIELNSHKKVLSSLWFLELDPLQVELKNFGLKKGSLEFQLAQIKLSELKSDYKNCWRLSQKIKSQAKEIEPWVVLTGLRCATKGFDQDKTLYASLEKEIKAIEGQMIWLYQGPFSSALRSQFIDTLLALGSYQFKTKRQKTWEIVDRLFHWHAWMSPEQRAMYFALIGDLNYVEQKWDASLEYYKKSTAAKTSPEIQKKIDQLNFELKKESVEKAIGNPTPASPQVKDTELNALEARMLSAHNSGNLGSLIEDASQILQKYPETSSAEIAAQKLLEVLYLVLEDEDIKYQPFKEMVVNAVELAPADRLARWARLLYGRGLYAMAHQLAIKAIKRFDGITNSHELYELAALAADHINDIEEASRLNRKITEKFPQTFAAQEATFRLGLENFRQKDYSQAIYFFETYLGLGSKLSNPGSNGGGVSNGATKSLMAMYWKVRSLEKLGKTEEAKIATEELLNRYPISYYGLLLRAEKNSGKLEIPFAPEAPIKVPYWLIDLQERGWRRLEILLKAGWMEEAQIELKNLPLPTTIELKLAFAPYFAAAMEYPTVIRWVTDAWDIDEKFRQKSFLNLTFPREFFSFIDAMAAKNKLDKDLVYSLIRQESAFNPRAVSRSGALGLMQLIPMTADECAQDLSLKSLKIPDEVFNPKMNVQLGTHYLAKMLRKYNGQVPLALAAYNVGPKRLDRWLGTKGLTKDLLEKKSWTPEDDLWIDELPWSETSYYVKAILRNFIVYRSLQSQQPISLISPVWKSID